MNPGIGKLLLAGVGELLWDRLPSGPRIGGAPANFARHAKALGARAAILSRVGDDKAGRSMLVALDESGPCLRGVTTDGTYATGMAGVVLGGDGQPRFTIAEDAAWDHLQATPAMLEIASAADAVCFGTLGQRNDCARHAIREIVAATRPGALRIFDVNLRQNYYCLQVIEASLGMANICKLNDAELPVISALLGLGGGVRDQIGGLLGRYGLRAVVYTRGAHGSLLTDGREWCDHAGAPVVVRDSVGAGDAFTCAVALGILLGWPLDKISNAAGALAAFVCSRDGAVPQLPEGLRGMFTS